MEGSLGEDMGCRGVSVRGKDIVRLIEWTRCKLEY